jgi:hypothetical protein
MVSGHDVDLVDEERMDEFIVKFKGPQDSLYTGVSLFRHEWSPHSFLFAGCLEGACVTTWSVSD